MVLLLPVVSEISCSFQLNLNNKNSTAVTHAQLANWEYMSIIRDAADPACSSRLVNSIATIDAILRQGTFKRPLKALFGLADLKHDEDFASVLEVRSCVFSLIVLPSYLTGATGRMAIQVLAS
jgi:hypothetical protein